MLHKLVAIAGILLILAIVWDAFEALVLPRTATRRLRPARLFYRVAWPSWTASACLFGRGRRRENFLAVFGPLSILLLMACWAVALLVGFAMVQWGLGSHLNVAHGPGGFWTDLYMSGTTLFTLGIGDVTPSGPIARALTVIEAGVGFGFLALVIGYLPVLYQGFSHREVNISLLDARAGSPPTAGELLLRHAQNMAGLEVLLRDWERWAAELMESHLSYPVLLYFRSQHEHQSWLGALTAILDASALVIVGVQGGPGRQAQLTFAMARHAVVDLSQATGVRPLPPDPDRLPPEDFHSLRSHLAQNGVNLKEGALTETTLASLRALYEPYVARLAERLRLTLPPWRAPADETDNWRTSAFEKGASGATGISDHHRDDHPHF
ncbi:MAG TPA: potassium channel family protein [Methylomirabilota bacterium]